MALSNVNERSTKIISIPFTDENGDAVTPTSVTWTLSDSRGTVVNSREDVEETPGTSITVVLSGDDTALDAAYFGTLRKLTVKAIYDSDAGSDLEMNAEETFSITPLVNVT